MGTTRLVAARKVARDRRAAMDAERARRDERIEEATAVAILATTVLARAQDAVTAAEHDVAVAVAALAGEDLPVTDIATLTDLPTGQVRRLLSLAKTTTPATSGRGDDAEPGGGPEARAPRTGEHQAPPPGTESMLSAARPVRGEGATASDGSAGGIAEGSR